MSLSLEELRMTFVVEMRRTLLERLLVFFIQSMRIPLILTLEEPSHDLSRLF